MRRMSSSKTPSFISFIGGKRNPSWWISVSERDSEAGTAPPMSVLWMWPPVKATISPSWKTGFQRWVSGAWVATKPL